nr:ribosomal protein L23 [Cryptomonas borealis]
MNLTTIIDLIKYPIITDKTTKLLEFNQFSFVVDIKSSKKEIKIAIEYLFKVKVKSINTCKKCSKIKRVGKFSGKQTAYKKAIITLMPGNSINLFSD